MTDLYIDDRYRGAHGIGRYAAEVIPRLRPAHRPLGLSGSPHTATDAFRRIPSGARRGVVYSPGYGPLLRAGRQVLTVHDLIQLRTPLPRRMAFAAYYAGPVRSVIRRAGVVITVSDTSAREIEEWLSDDQVRVVNAGNGCSAAFRASGPAPVEDPYIVFVGNMRRHKNLDVVLRALRRVPEVRLRAVLPSAEIPAAARRAADLGVSRQVAWLHGIGDERLAALYRGAAATVVPSVDEGFGLPALESISCGVPVIHWIGCRAVAEIVGERGTGVASSDDAEEWGDALGRACATIRRVSLPTGQYDWARTAEVVSDVLDSVLDGS